MRLCKHCNLMKDELSEFYPGKLYPSSRCKTCENERAKASGKKQRADPVAGPRLKKKRTARNKLPEVIEQNRARDRKRHVKYKQSRNTRSARYFQQNKRAVYDRHAAFKRNNVCAKLRSLVHGSIVRALKSKDGSKAGKSFTKYLPYTMKELRYHLESLWEP